MGTPPCESGFIKVTVARRWETADRRTEYGLDGTSGKRQQKVWIGKLKCTKAGKAHLQREYSARCNAYGMSVDQSKVKWQNMCLPKVCHSCASLITIMLGKASWQARQRVG